MFERCPKAWLLDLEETGLLGWIEEWDRFKGHSVLPWAGSANDQDPRFWQAATALDNEWPNIVSDLRRIENGKNSKVHGRPGGR